MCTNNQQEINNTKNGMEYCTTKHTINGQELSNAYLCHQKRFSAADMWRIQKNKRIFIVRTNKI